MSISLTALGYYYTMLLFIDTNGDGVLDEAEVEALFQREVSGFIFLLPFFYLVNKGIPVIPECCTHNL